jgi:hypothetical protein
MFFSNNFLKIIIVNMWRRILKTKIKMFKAHFGEIIINSLKEKLNMKEKLNKIQMKIKNNLKKHMIPPPHLNLNFIRFKMFKAKKMILVKLKNSLMKNN